MLPILIFILLLVLFLIVIFLLRSNSAAARAVPLQVTRNTLKISVAISAIDLMLSDRLRGHLNGVGCVRVQKEIGQVSFAGDVLRSTTNCETVSQKIIILLKKTRKSRLLST